MDKFVKKLIERLEENQNITLHFNGEPPRQTIDFVKAISIVNQLTEEYKPCHKPCTDCEEYDLVRNHCPKLCKVIKETVKEMEENHSKWILCSERLPESGVSVIVSYKDRFLSKADGTCEGWYDATNMIWHLTDYEYSDNVEVIAWRERLAPYQPKGE